MKDELQFRILKEWISLRPKVYSMIVEDNILQKNSEKESETVRKIKGVGKSASKEVTFQDFYNCLFNFTPLKVSFNSIQSKNHKLSTINIHKSALSHTDNKRVICEDNISTLALGHYSLRDIVDE